jgi:predicted nuclease with TOPRIM domain
MTSELSERLAKLRTEFRTGQARLSELEIEQAYLRERLLMIKGAIEVLQDLLAGAADAGRDRAPADAAANGLGAGAPGARD